MDKKQTNAFIKRARAYAKRRKWTIHTLSRHLFDQNPYGFERLEKAMDKEAGGPPHVNVLAAMKRLDEMEAAEEDERTVAAR